jgi:hypothetical protein
MPNLLQPVSVSIVLTIQMLLLGYAVNQVLGLWDHMPEPAQNSWLKIFFGLSVGFAIDTTALFLLGVAGWLSGKACIITLGGMTLLAASQLKPRFLARPQLADLFSLTAVLLLFVAVTLPAIRVTGHWDDIMYQLPLAQSYVQQHQITLQPYIRYPLFPQNMNLLFALGLMTGGRQFGAEIVAQFLASVPLFITGLGLIGALRWTTGATWPGFFAAVLLLGLGNISEELGYAYVDNGLILYCWATVLAIALFISHENSGWRSPWLLIAGLMAGMAMGTKYFGVVLVSFPALWLLVVRRDWRAMLVYGATALIFGSWWYIRAWAVSGDPIHPLGGNIFGYFLWNAQDLRLFVEGARRSSAGSGAIENVSTFGFFIKRAGLGLLALVPLSLIYWRRLGPGLTLILAVTLCYFGFWIYVTWVARYLAPIDAAVIFLGIWSLWQIGQTLMRNISWLGGVKITRSKIAGAFLCVIAVIVPANNALKQTRNQLRNWQENLWQQPGYSLMQQANQLIPRYGNRLINIGFENAVFFYNGIAIGDWYGPGRYEPQMIKYSGSGGVYQLIPPELMREVMGHYQARTLLVNRARIGIDLPAYERDFTLQELTPDGVLLTLK